MWIPVSRTMDYKSVLIVCVVILCGDWMNVCGNAQTIDVGYLPNHVEGFPSTFYKTSCPDVESIVDVEYLPKPVEGLSWTFYKTTCPNLESIVSSILDDVFAQDITQAAGLLRLHFHDCFVQGCDGSVLLNITDSSSERQVSRNLSLRDRAFEIIDEIKAAVEASCSGVVSCADILTLAARDSVAKAGGPQYPVPLGRRDSLNFADESTVLANLPIASNGVDAQTTLFASKGLNLIDFVSLSGGHTIGLSFCIAFDERLYNKSTGAKQQDPSLEQSFADSLYSVCPAVNNTVNTTNLDLVTADAFDSNYYVNVQNNQTLFTSDQTLYFDSTTRSIVDVFAADQNVFFHHFIVGMVKMGQIEVLTGTEGEIRSKCSIDNPSSANKDQIIEPIVNPQDSPSESI